MILRTLFTLLLSLFTYNFALAGVHIKDIFSTTNKSKDFINQFTFYATPFTAPDQVIIKKYCLMPQEKADLFLQNQKMMAAKDHIAAYHYGMLTGFADCIENKPQKAIKYLLQASNNGITRASYLMGLLFLKDNNIEQAQKFFLKGIKALHSKSAYNYALIDSDNLMKPHKNNLKLLKIAASEGHDFVRHDTEIFQLKLSILNNEIIHRPEIMKIKKTLSSIINKSDDERLKAIAEKNIEIINALKMMVQSKIKNPINLFSALKHQSMKHFNTYMNAN